MNKTELKKAFDGFAKEMGIIEKDVISLETVNFDDLMPRQAVEELLQLQREQNSWLGSLNNITRQQAAGTVPILDIAEPVTEGVDEDDPTMVSNKPENRRASYRCRKFKSQWNVTWEDLREARAAGLGNFEETLRSAFATAIGNDKADATINSDTSLPGTTRLNRLLNRLDGVRKQMLAGGNVKDFQGAAFDPKMFGQLEDDIPDRFANDPMSRWLYNRKVENRWKLSLTNVNTTEHMRSALGDQAISTQAMVSPWGIMQTIVPQVRSNQGPTAIAPTSATASGSGIEFVLTTLVTATYVADVASGVGRKFKVTNVNTGVSETVLGYQDTTLRIKTAGKLGQITVSTQVADYVVTLADETDIYLINPQAITVVDCMEMRSYRKYNQDRDRFEIVVYHEFDVLVPTPEVGAIGTRVQLDAIA